MPGLVAEPPTKPREPRLLSERMPPLESLEMDERMALHGLSERG